MARHPFHLFSLLASLLAAVASSSRASPTSSSPPPLQQQQLQQLVFTSAESACHPPSSLQEGVGHFSQWSACNKELFLKDVEAGKAGDWTIVLGNEAGDLDSLAAAFTWAYHQGHIDPSKPAIGLLQTPFDALDLRPENKLALANIKMTSGHQDLLTIDELPMPAEQIAPLLRGIVLVDHPVPTAEWENATIRGIIDHHADRGAGKDASPRILEPVASCSTLIGRQMLDDLESLPEGEYHLPHELLELLLSAIAIDSDGLKSKVTTPIDHFVASRLFKRSNWRNESFYDKMLEVEGLLKKAKKDLDHLNVRDLLRRDWKGGIAHTADHSPDVHLGFASIPYPLPRLIEITPNKTVADFFAIERNWTSEIGADITLALLSYKVKKGKKVGLSASLGEEREEPEFDYEGRVLPPLSDISSMKSKKSKKYKERQIILVVRADHRITESQADSLFAHVSKAIDSSEIILPKKWQDHGQLGERQMVWTHWVRTGGRKLVRPIVEDALKTWKMQEDVIGL